MDLNDEEVQQRAETDRRGVDPPVQVETASWSRAGQLDWWVRDRQEWFGRIRGKTAGNDGLKLVIFVLRAAQSYDLGRTASWSTNDESRKTRA
jgi:hypothetical protein